ncbi:hypothetical protein [Saccharopolyspora sp. ASAGF58]|uniref:hypothetical protein n=1 Tax=Saccharopolyspora sp. ASAGF58 TaxID=2719023 RepID=UPI0014400409|nr:hypothetical protein [Saccharopolyspora sp. ASAGF58]QIZ33663.1 hypothetical protein FDZ84_01615 [Saccharopolyspora sp. ASAGF58]
MKTMRIAQSLTLAGLAVVGLATTSAAALAGGTTESPTHPTPPIECTPDGVPAPTLPISSYDPSEVPGVPANPIYCVPAGEPGVPPSDALKA